MMRRFPQEGQEEGQEGQEGQERQEERELAPPEVEEGVGALFWFYGSGWYCTGGGDDRVGESSDEDEPIEDMEFIEKHKEWIDKVMKDEMSFTVSQLPFINA